VLGILALLIYALSAASLAVSPTAREAAQP
jgi:hypothetical protein